MAPESWHALMLCAPVCTVVFPAGHGWHVVFTTAPVLIEYVPAGHFWHSDAPGTALYVPGGQVAHAECTQTLVEYVVSPQLLSLASPARP